jgi:hypothetical protein
VLRLTAFMLLGTLGVVLAPVTMAAARRPAALGVPALSPPVCKPAGPVVLRPGSEPRSALRVDLARVASTTGGQVALERVSSRTTLANGRTQVIDSTRKTTGALTLGRIANGRVPVVGHFRITTTSSAATSAFSLRGYFDALNGGSWGATAINDHLPVAPVGVGASWRVVNCQPIDATPAKETRVYTLRSVAHGIVVASFRDDVEIDGAHVDLGTQREGGTTVHVRLVGLHGSATGTVSLPLANGLEQRSKTVTRFSASVEVLENGEEGPVLETTEVDTETDLPSA